MDSSSVSEADRELLDNPLFSIAPSGGSVTIEGKTYKIKGVPFRVIMSIARESPDVLSVFFGGAITLSTITETSPKAVERIIAAGFGLIDDPRAMQWAGDLEMAVQLDLVAAILMQTTGGGAVPFAERLRAVRLALAGAPPAATTSDAATEAPAKGNGRMRMREPTTPPNDAPISPPSSNSSSPEAA